MEGSAQLTGEQTHRCTRVGEGGHNSQVNRHTDIPGQVRVGISQVNRYTGVPGWVRVQTSWVNRHKDVPGWVRVGTSWVNKHMDVPGWVRVNMPMVFSNTTQCVDCNPWNQRVKNNSREGGFCGRVFIKLQCYLPSRELRTLLVEVLCVFTKPRSVFRIFIKLQCYFPSRELRTLLVEVLCVFTKPHSAFRK